MRKIYCVIFLCLFAAVSCVTNKSTIDELTSLQEELEQNYEVYEEKDWKEFSHRYEELEEEMSHREYTVEERKQIRKVQGKITAIMAKRTLNDFKSQLENLPSLLQQVLEETDGFLQGLNEGLQENDEESEE